MNPPATTPAEPITPLAYGLLETRTLKLLMTNIYVREEVARQAAERLTNQYKTYVVVPLFGPDAHAYPVLTHDHHI